MTRGQEVHMDFNDLNPKGKKSGTDSFGRGGREDLHR